MRTSDVDILLVPGLGGSGPDHWQSRWEAKLSTARRIEQLDWDQPQRDPWVEGIVAAVLAAERPTVLVAHSLGVWAVAHAGPRLAEGAAKGKVAGALLVAPPDADKLADFPEIEPAFADFTPTPLPFPALVIGSSNDPFATKAGAESLAAALGATFVDAGEAGHINADSGHGPWPEGLMRFAGFLKSLG